jgi:hypothetical protein
MQKINGTIKDAGRDDLVLRTDNKFGISIWNYQIDNFFTTPKAAKNGKKIEGLMRWIMVDTEDDVMESIGQLITKRKLKVS